MHIVAVPLLGIIFNILLQCIEANLALDFKVTKISGNHKPAANCNVANTTYAHGETFKLDCKTQCVCENGRHACSSLCPKEQLPAPEDTISCRSPRLVEVPGHCCKMWLCENPTADVYATCHNSSTSPWTPCSRKCGIGISTRFTTTTAGCNQLSNLRLCENRKCETLADNSRHKLQLQQHQQQQQQPLAAVWHKENHKVEEQKEQDAKKTEEKQKYLMKTKQLKNKLKRWKQQQQQQLQHHDKHEPVQQEFIEHEHHRIRKGHECRSIQRLGPARIRLGECVSKKLYRPKICGRCHQNTKCCVPSVSTTIQVELLCPLNAMDPISYVQQQLTTEGQQQQQQQQGQQYYTTSDTSASATPSITATISSTLTSLWDTHSLDAIDQEYLQSHQIQIENKFIAVEWILKCECTNNDNCQRIVNTTITDNNSSGRASGSSSSSTIRSRNSKIVKSGNHKFHDYDDSENVDNHESNRKNIQRFKMKRYNNNNKKEIYEKQTAKTTTTTRHIDNNAGQIWSDEHDEIDNDDIEDDEHDDDGDDDDENDAAEMVVDNDSDININIKSNRVSVRDRAIAKAKAKAIINSEGYINGHWTYSHNHKKQTRDYDGIYKNTNNNNNNYNYYNNKDKHYKSKEYNDNGEEEMEVEKHKNIQKKWPDSLSYSLLTHDKNEDEKEEEEEEAAMQSASLSSSSSSSSYEIQPDIIPDPPTPFSANKRTSNNNNNNNNSSSQSSNNNKDNNKSPQTNRLKEKFKLKHNTKQQQHQQQLLQQHHEHEQHYEHWLQKQYDNNKPHQQTNLAT